ncbi:MAG TPA: PH domain-containing protein [Candidatus Dormibacteraeota bacterium]|nr:PH domain-containing protein [Candidatus Dormibacteraeota bacterium]
MSNLLPGENLVLKAHPHWITFIRSLIVPAVLVIVVLWADFTILLGNYTSWQLPVHFRTFLTLAVVAFAGLWLIVVWVRWQSTAYTLTDQRIKIETGIFGRQEKVIPIDRVQDCTTKQSVFGRMLGYGRVEIDAAGAQGAEILDHLPNPGTFRDQVFVQSEKRRGGGVPAGSPVPANPSGL